MKKLISYSLVALTCLLLVACKPAPTETPKKSDTAEKQEEKTKEDKNTEITQPEPAPVNNGPEYTEESNRLFAEYFVQRAPGNLFLTVEPVGKESIAVIVVNEMQQVEKHHKTGYADSLYGMKNGYFYDWAKENGYDTDFLTPPSLIIKTEDGTLFAQENTTLGDMELAN